MTMLVAILDTDNSNQMIDYNIHYSLRSILTKLIN